MLQNNRKRLLFEWGRGKKARIPPFSKMLCFKIYQHITINEESDIFEGGGGEMKRGVAPTGKLAPRSQILISIIIDKHTKMLCFKFH